MLHIVSARSATRFPDSVKALRLLLLNPSSLLDRIFKSSLSSLSVLAWCFQTAILFTWTDFKTIFFPVIAFACSTTPVHSISRLIHTCAWTWAHLLLCNVSNQARSRLEDSINRPWRPLPSGRVSELCAVRLRWILILACTIWSSSYGYDMLIASIALSVTTICYDELGMAAHPLGKNFCCVFGYVSFEFGATKLIGHNKDLDTLTSTAILISGALISTTIQTQDFADTEGDIALGRITFPIFAPKFSRIFTSLALVMWSAFLGWFWGVDTVTLAILNLLGGYVALRIFSMRSSPDDKRSYVIYNIWLTLAHALPLHFRIDFSG